MLLIFSAFLFCFILIGWSFFFAKMLKTGVPTGLFNATAFCGLAIFCGFLLSIPTTITLGIAGLGGLFGMLPVFNIRNTRPSRPILMPVFVFLIAAVLCLLTASGMQFKSIDDYSFWGVMSKYLFTFDSLPHNDDYINANFLTYTPVLACLHYLIFTLARQYSQFLGYFAQGITFIAALLVVGNFKNTSRALVNISLMFILFSLAYGNVLARMEVDAYVAAWFFAITWIIYKKRQDALPLIVIPLLFLSVIKEIGLLLAVYALVMYVVLERPKGIKQIQCFAILLALLTIKFLWKHHVGYYGFQSFSKGVSLHSALLALNPLNTNYQFVQYLYLKEILFSNFDHLIRAPWLLIYVIIGGLWYYLIKNYPLEKSRVNKIMRLFMMFTIIYLLMLYILQALVFQVAPGKNTRILDFQRYYNMLFLPWFSLTIFISLDIIKPHVSKVTSILAVTAALVFLAGGKIERMRKFYQPYEFYKVHALITEQASHVANANWTLCLLNPPQPAYEIRMPLAWFFMPNRVYETSSVNNTHCDITIKWEGSRFIPA